MIVGFDLLLADRDTYLLAARIAAMCRGSGIATTTVDCLIAAQTLAAGGRLFTLDRDFEPIARRCGLRLHAWRQRAAPSTLEPTGGPGRVAPSPGLPFPAPPCTVAVP